jgi:hypothetical protein
VGASPEHAGSPEHRSDGGGNRSDPIDRDLGRGGCGLQIDGDMILGSTGGVGVVRSVMNRCVRMIRWFGSSVGSIVNTPRCSINILCACMYIYTQRVYTQYILSDY